MNDYLVTYDGGQDVWADDLSFMQNSLKSMIDTAVRTYGENCILWGCLDSGKTNVVEGGVVISGKLYQVPALGAIGSNKLCFREVLSDERTFENQQVHKVKKQYEAYLSTDTSGAVAWIDLKTASKADGRVTDLEGKVSTLESYNSGTRLPSLEEDVSTLKKKTQAYTELIDGSSSSLNDIIAKLKEYKSVRVHKMTRLITNNLAKSMYNNGQWQGIPTDIEFVLEIVSETDQKYIVIATANDNTIYKGVGTMSIAKSGATAYLYGLYQAAQ